MSRTALVRLRVIKPVTDAAGNIAGQRETEHELFFPVTDTLADLAAWAESHKVHAVEVIFKS